jgi:hypothetical protein
MKDTFVIGIQELPQSFVPAVHKSIHGVPGVARRTIVITGPSIKKLTSLSCRIFSGSERSQSVITKIGRKNGPFSPLTIPESVIASRHTLRKPARIESELDGPGLSLRQEPNSKPMLSMRTITSRNTSLTVVNALKTNAVKAFLKPYDMFKIPFHIIQPFSEDRPCYFFPVMRRE